jgi:hypothetical protein
LDDSPVKVKNNIVFSLKENLKKESLGAKEGVTEMSSFLIKILPAGWRFLSKPAGLELYIPGAPTYLCFSF